MSNERGKAEGPEGDKAAEIGCLRIAIKVDCCHTEFQKRIAINCREVSNEDLKGER